MDILNSSKITVIVASFILAGCKTVTHWLPKNAGGDTLCPVPSKLELEPGDPIDGPNKGPWVSRIYIDKSKDAEDENPFGADISIRINFNGTWSAAKETEPGFYSDVLYTGKLDEKGKLVGLPASVYNDARGIWSVGRRDPNGVMKESGCSIGGEPIYIGDKVLFWIPRSCQ